MAKTSSKLQMLLPRFIRFRDAPFYMGMDRNRFNKELRPHLTAIVVGVQGIAFDRLELDALGDAYKSRNGRPGLTNFTGETWGEKNHRGSSCAPASGKSTNTFTGSAFASALERLASKKRSIS